MIHPDALQLRLVDLGGRGQQDRGDAGQGLVVGDQRRELEPVELRHAHVQHEHGERVIGGQRVEHAGHDVLGPGDDARAHAPLRQLRLEDQPVGRVVIDDEDPEAGQQGAVRQVRTLVRDRRLTSNQKVLPALSSLSTPMTPSITSINRREIARPSPVPP